MPENYNEIELNSKSSYDYYLNEFYDKYQNKTSTALTDVPAKLHIVTDDGGDTTITVDMADAADAAAAVKADSCECC